MRFGITHPWPVMSVLGRPLPALVNDSLTVLRRRNPWSHRKTRDFQAKPADAGARNGSTEGILTGMPRI